MAGPEDTERYLFDDEALERALANGSEQQHDTIWGCSKGSLCLTRAAKERFLSVFPEERPKLTNFSIIRRKVQDNYLAANFADQLSNYPDIDRNSVQEKVYLLATAFREGATVVTGEFKSPTTRIKVLAKQVGVSCINIDEFFEKFE